MMSSAPRVPTEKPEEIIDKKLEKMIASAPPVPANEPGEASEAKNVLQSRYTAEEGRKAAQPGGA